MAERVQGLAGAGRADRMPAADQAAAGVDRQFGAELDDAVFHRLPRLSGIGQAEVVDRHVLRGGEAVVRFDAVHLPDVRQAGALQGVHDGVPRVWQHVRVAAALGDLGVERDRRGVVAPAQNPGQSVQASAAAGGVLLGERFGCQKDRRRPVRHLRTVAHAQPAGDRVGELARLEVLRFVREPAARLRVGVAARVREIDLRDAGQVLLFQAVTFVVHVAELPEQFGERELHALGLACVPRRGAQKIAARGRIDGLHLFDADDERHVVAAGLDLRGRHEHGDAARGAGRFVPRGRNTGQLRIDLGQKGAQVSLLAVEFGREVADVGHVHLARLDAGRREAVRDGLLDHIDDAFAFLAPVAGKIGLMASENVHGCGHGVPPPNGVIPNDGPGIRKRFRTCAACAGIRRRATRR